MADEKLDLTDVDDEEAEALREHLAQLRRKKEAKTKLAEAMAALEEAQAEIDDIEWTEDDNWHEQGAEGAAARAKRAHAQEAAEARRREGPRSDFLKRAWGEDNLRKQAAHIEAALDGHDLVDSRLAPGQRTARQLSEGQHLPGALSADRHLPEDYDDHVRVVPHRFKHRAWNPRTRVDDSTMSRLKKLNPDLDWDE